MRTDPDVRQQPVEALMGEDSDQSHSRERCSRPSAIEILWICGRVQNENELSQIATPSMCDRGVKITPIWELIGWQGCFFPFPPFSPFQLLNRE
jgi:hypothetical protein